MDVWPLARMDLYLDMHWANVGDSPPALRPLPLRALSRIATPLRNVWRSRHDLRNWVIRPRAAQAIFLGDGVSLDLIDNEWQDRFGEPVIAELQNRGLATFLMQGGEPIRLPWHRPTFAANVIAAWGALAASAASIPVVLPDHGEVLRFLGAMQVRSPSLGRTILERRARVVFATASAFDRVLRIVKPGLAFVVTYYAGLGAAFLVACRRRGILSVDLQHCPQGGAHKAYGWSALPTKGYSTLPAVFWNWTEADAAYIRHWTSRLALPWHRSVHGGNTQLNPFMDETDPRTVAWDVKFDAIGGGASFDREILVALQPIGGCRAHWEGLGRQIASAPSRWRWWIRRHPASSPNQDQEYHHLLSIRSPNVVIDEASSMPLPALLRHMSLVLSIASGASAEAAALGVPALFLSEEARGPFAGLIERGLASIIDVHDLNTEIARLPAAPVRPAPIRQPGLSEVLRNLEEIAHDYSNLCRAL